jgi:hypothetical protein
MLEMAGVDKREYARRVERVLKFDSVEHGSDLGDGSLLRHTSGLGVLDVAFMIPLGRDVTFVSGPTPDATRIIVDAHIPETMTDLLVGRPVVELVEHPVLMVEGLTIASIENRSQSPSDAPHAVVDLSPMAWRHLPGTRHRPVARVLRWIRNGVGV